MQDSVNKQKPKGLTPFGVRLRKLRLERDELQKDMAVRLGVSEGYLSSVERGRRNPPKGWADLIADTYDLDVQDRQDLKQEAGQSRTYDRLDVSRLSLDDKYLVQGIVKYIDTAPAGVKAMIEAWINLEISAEEKAGIPRTSTNIKVGGSDGR